MERPELMRTTKELRQVARYCFDAAVAAADPEAATRRAVESEQWQAWHRVRAVSFGKAACTMASAFDGLVGTDLWAGPGVIVTNYENVRDVPGFEIIGAGHPLPDAGGVRGAQAVAKVARNAKEDELLLVLISGGGSAILPSPAPPITLEEKVATTDLLLACGANIGELNTLRKHISLLKGGGLARFAAPAALHALILSDVIGDDLSTIASGTTVPDPTSFADAVSILETFDLLDRVPPAVRHRLLAGVSGDIPETPKPGDPLFSNTTTTLIGGNGHSLAALEHATRTKMTDVTRLSDTLCGEARSEARRYVEAARQAIAGGAQRPFAISAGGETTVTVKGSGLGGRNQELALAFAIEAERVELSGNWVFLSGGTDGRDGPNDAAGGIVDPESLRRMRAAGVDPQERLDDNDSYHALESCGDLLITGPTGTNVADVQILLVG